MKIIQVNTTYSIGGAATIANKLHNYLNSNTDNISHYVYGRGNSNDANSSKISSNLEVYTSGAITRLTGSDLCFNYKNLERFIRNTDIVHIHNLHGYYINYELLIMLINKLNKKVIWSVHDIWPITGRCAVPNECTNWIEGCNRCMHKDIYPSTYVDKANKNWKKKNILFNSLSKERTMIVTPSNWLADKIKTSYLNSFPLKVIANGTPVTKANLNTKEITRKKHGLPKDKKIIMFVAANLNDKRKGIGYILNLLDKFNKDVMFISVGMELKNFKSDKLKQFGYISDKQVLNELYSCSDIYLNTSLGESFSLTTIEAFSNRVPVIAFNIGAISELIGNNCGITVEVGNELQLENAVRNLIYDKSKINEFSNNAYKKFLKLYTEKTFYKNYIDLYKYMYDKESQISFKI